MNSRDAANTVFQASALDARCEQARDPATAGVRVMVAVRRSIVPAGRPGAVESVSLLDVSPSLNCAGWVTPAGGFFPPSREDRPSDPAVMPRSGVAAPFVKMRVPDFKCASFGKEGST